MWIFRYFLPGIVLIILGGFAFQNINQKLTIRFLYWDFYNVPFILVIAIAFVAGIFLRYLVVFTHWMDKRKIEKTKQKLVETEESVINTEEKKDVFTTLEKN